MKKKKTINDYNYPANIVKLLEPIVNSIEQDRPRLAEQKMAKLAIELISDIESNKIGHKEADKVFTLLDIFLSDNFNTIEFSENFKSLIFEGMILHDLGKSYGADIELMKELSNKILGNSSR